MNCSVQTQKTCVHHVLNQFMKTTPNQTLEYQVCFHHVMLKQKGIRVDRNSSTINVERNPSLPDDVFSGLAFWKETKLVTLCIYNQLIRVTHV
jgi:hypothetical protein